MAEKQNNQIVNTYAKGINQDLAKTLYKEGNYLNALNITLLTDSGLSTAVVQNKKGNKLQFKFPTIIRQADYELTGEYPVTVPEQNTLTCIAGVEINGVIFLMTMSKSNFIYTGVGQIWRCSIDIATENTNDTTNGYQLNVADHLMYNRDLGLSIYNRPKLIGKYENENFRRLVWADGLNPLRTINTIGDLSDLNNIPVRTLDIVTEANLETPTISKLVIGNLPEGKYQVGYRLLSKEGALTRFSSCSNLIDVIQGDEFNSELDYPLSDTIEFTTDQDAKFNNFKELKSSDKGIEFYINSIDKDYSMIQYCLIYYSEPNIPEIYLFPYKEISLYTKQKETLTELYADTFNVSPEEFNMFYSPFEVVKTLDVKENTLFVANTSNKEFKVDVDYRAYRFNGVGETTTYELDGTTNTFTESNYPSNLKLDVINPYNDESGTIFGLNSTGTPTDWYNDQQYKFQSDGVTPGGEGPNIKYTFGTTSLVVDTNSANQGNKPPFVKTQVDTSNLLQSVPNHINNNNGSFSSLKSPYKSSCQVSWQRGEVYRFGITFYNLKGQPSYVNWVGDIKMPDFNEFNNTTSLLCTYGAGTLNMYSTFIEFTVNIPLTLAQDISGFKIVYVQREDKDKTRFGTGITGGFNQFNKGSLDFLNTPGHEDIIKLIIGFAASAVKQVTDNLEAGASTFIEDVFNIKDKIADTISGMLGSAIRDKIENSFSNIDRLMNPKHISDMIISILEGVTNQKQGLLAGFVSLPTSALFKLFSPPYMQLIRNILDEKFDDFFVKKVAGLSKNVLCLGNSFANSTITNGTSNLIGYTISPSVDFNRYKFRNGDYFKPVQHFPNVKLINEIHRDTTVGIYNPIDSSAYVRKWYNGSTFSWNQVADSSARRINISNQKVLKPGELLGSGFDSLLNTTELDFIISNSFINKLPKTNAAGTIMNPVTLLSDASTAIIAAGYTAVWGPAATLALIGFSRGEKTLGIGDKKMLFITNIQKNSSGLTNYHNYETKELESNQDNLIYFGASDTIRTVDKSGDYVISINRPNSSNQYNGIGYTSRANNIYISASEFYLIKTRSNTNNSYVINANLGDTYVGVYGAVNYCYYYDQINPEGYQRAIRTKKGLYDIFPCEADFNFTLREGLHTINNASPDELEETSEFKLEEKKRPVRKYLRNLREKIFKIQLEPAKSVLRTKRFLLSDFQFNEVFNQKYNINTFFPESILFNTEVDKYTNRIWHSKTKIDGELIDSWRDFQLTDYIDVEGTQGPIVEICVNKNKLFYYQTNGIGIAATNERGQVVDSEGSSIVLSNGKLLARYDYITKETGTQHQFGVINTNQGIYHYDGSIKKLFKFGEGLECISDNLGLFSKLQSTNNLTNNLDTTLFGIGVHGIYDTEYQTVYFTFLGTDGFTIGYNEKLNAFESFYDFIPNLYFKLDKKVISSLTNNNECYWHNKGNYGQFYGTYYPSSITLLSSEDPLQTKTWGNQQFQTQVYNTNNVLLNSETITSIEHKTENQETGLITLTPQVNINKVERDWKLQIQRDIANATYSTISKPRLRDMYLETKINFINVDNKRFILHPVITTYINSIH